MFHMSYISNNCHLSRNHFFLKKKETKKDGNKEKQEGNFVKSIQKELKDKLELHNIT